MKCPTLEQLVEFVDGRLVGDQARVIASHLEQGCQKCEADREWYSKISHLAASDDSIEPPGWVLKRGLSVFGSKRSSRVTRRIGKLVASLVFDSLAQPAVAGVRSSEGVARQLLFKAGDYSIDLQIAAEGGTQAMLMGQILRQGEQSFASVAGLRIELTRARKVVRETVCDEFGEFAVTDLDEGEYDLLVDLTGTSIHMPGVTIRR